MIEIPIIKSAFDIYAKHYHSLGDYSATTIIDSPRRVELFRRYGDQVVYTPESQAASLVGTAVHEKIESLLRMANVVHPEYIVEKGMAIPWEMTDGKVLLLGGKPDVIIPKEGWLNDIKTCKTWKVIYDPKHVEWSKQANIYRFMLADKGIEINRLTVVAFFLDWVENQKLRKHDYPDEPIMEYEIPVWEMQDTFEFICERMEAHYRCSDLEDAELPRCTPEEMWENPPEYAIFKNEAAKRAMKVCRDTDLHGAIDIAQTIKGVSSSSYVLTRYQRRKRCEKFCAVNEWCSQYQEYVKSGALDFPRTEIFQLGGVL